MLIVVPTYNERDNVRLLLPAVRESVPDADILVVDDNSPDGTGDAVVDAAEDLEQIVLLRRPGKLGLGSAYRAGFDYGLDRGYDVVVSMDVDLSHDPAVLPELLGLIDAGADAVIGSRYVPGGSTLDWPWYRRALFAFGATDTPRSSSGCRSGTARLVTAPIAPRHSRRSTRRPRRLRATPFSRSSSAASCAPGSG